MHAVAEDAASAVEALSGAANVLLLSPAMDGSGGEACASLLSAAPADRADVLSVTFNDSPDARIERWSASGGPTAAANLGFLVVGEEVRSAAAAAPVGGGPSVREPGPTVESITNPGDLTGIGIKVGGFLDDWTEEGHQLLVCFHTLTTFLQYTDLRSVYQFVHALTGRVRAAGGQAHYHLDPTAHDQRTVNTLMGLFDAVVEADGRGGWTVRRRR